jgi:hypothetical protein
MSLGRRENTRIHGELDALASLGLLREAQVIRLKERYPTTAADYLALVRAFTVLGAVTAVAGLVVLVRNHLDWWLVSETGLALAGAGLRLARGYGLTFLIINVSTFYFQFVAANTGEAWFLHLLLVGGSLLGLGVYLERKPRGEPTLPPGGSP